MHEKIICKKNMSKKAGRGKKWTTDEVSRLLDFVEKFLPAGQNQWATLCAAYNKDRPHWCSDRDVDALSWKFKSLRKVGKPTGNPTCPPDVVRAKRLFRAIENNMGTVDDDSDEGGGSSSEDSSEESVADAIASASASSSTSASSSSTSASSSSSTSASTAAADQTAASAKSNSLETLSSLATPARLGLNPTELAQYVTNDSQRKKARVEQLIEGRVDSANKMATTMEELVRDRFMMEKWRFDSEDRWRREMEERRLRDEERRDKAEEERRVREEERRERSEARRDQQFMILMQALIGKAIVVPSVNSTDSASNSEATAQ